VVFQYILSPKSPNCYSVPEGFANHRYSVPEGFANHRYSVPEGFANHSSTLDQDRLEFCNKCCRSGPETCDPAYQCGSCLAGVPLPPFSLC
jgi:hypothetical protein